MLKLVCILSLLVYVAVSFPQDQADAPAPGPEVEDGGGPKSPEPDDAEDISSAVVEKFGENDPSEITPDDDCDGYSCTGLEYERTVGNETISYGQCQRANYCFVKESSSCTKFESKQFPGKFISTQACDHPLAPKPRSIGSSCCYKVEVDCTECNERAHKGQSSRYGYYYKQAGTVNGRAHWEHSNGKDAIWYTQKNNGQWCVGKKSDLGEARSGMYTNDDDECPYQPAYTWQFFSSDLDSWFEAKKSMSIWCRS